MYCWHVYKTWFWYSNLYLMDPDPLGLGDAEDADKEHCTAAYSCPQRGSCTRCWANGWNSDGGPFSLCQSWHLVCFQLCIYLLLWCMVWNVLHALLVFDYCFKSWYSNSLGGSVCLWSRRWCWLSWWHSLAQWTSSAWITSSDSQR